MAKRERVSNRALKIQHLRRQAEVSPAGMWLKRLLLLPAIQFVLPTGIRFGFFPSVKENPSCICVRLDDLTSEVSHYASHSCLIEPLIFVGFFLVCMLYRKKTASHSIFWISIHVGVWNQEEQCSCLYSCLLVVKFYY